MPLRFLTHLPSPTRGMFGAEALDGQLRDLHRGVVGLADDARHLVPGSVGAPWGWS